MKLRTTEENTMTRPVLMMTFWSSTDSDTSISSSESLLLSLLFYLHYNLVKTSTYTALALVISIFCILRAVWKSKQNPYYAFNSPVKSIMYLVWFHLFCWLIRNADNLELAQVTVVFVCSVLTICVIHFKGNSQSSFD